MLTNHSSIINSSKRFIYDRYSRFGLNEKAELPSFQSPLAVYNDLLATELLPITLTGFSTTRPLRNDDSCILNVPQRSILDSGTGIKENDYSKDVNYEIFDPFATIPLRSVTMEPSFLSKACVGMEPISRRIPKGPFKILDAPNLQDDFYLNLVDWSSTNLLAVGLSSSLYLWNASTSKVTNLMSLPEQDLVTSVSWTQQGNHVAIGTRQGSIQIWDVTVQKKVRTLGGHRARVGAMDWCGPILATGGRDHTVLLRDVREQEHWCNRWLGHKQEVCGVKWSPNEMQLATGGNDNKLLIWSQGYETPVCQFQEHTAAVKALSWSPHQSGLLASGGGTADRHIRVWNTVTNCCVMAVDTGSQVCNIAWSGNVNELVSTHGYSLNQVILWKWPSMQKIVTLTGHTYRVLYLAVSPDGQTIVTGAGDETLRFWQIFPSGRPKGPRNLAALAVPHTPAMR
ncbi:uncharacterized protein CMU_019890 [Cryptosporidium muris RN66]|uniref:CDC20/Fizzy WD40 domain-containing protein n=1 Tax=Cryptosporidium muris (strain RN66) TaxID=441375 RepID=B6AJA8_CRYMR|nr:uncharacterized protein CMU_019890 [Cryptosporidium muris RN66]EEA08246.1 hypothetical protein, conserved [Cryptosporidium muris RN66]|eukprot:XP_002142595.1 hypothetical protein [Cryptosporidium muris RN66]